MMGESCGFLVAMVMIGGGGVMSGVIDGRWVVDGVGGWLGCKRECCGG